MLTHQQFADLVHDFNDHDMMAQSWHLLGNSERSRQHAAISRHAQRRIRAHVRERRRRLRAVLARSEHNIIGRMVVERILREEMDPR
jgi:predicted GNAT family N-acyltransferase